MFSKEDLETAAQEWLAGLTVLMIIGGITSWLLETNNVENVIALCMIVILIIAVPWVIGYSILNLLVRGANSWA